MALTKEDLDMLASWENDTRKLINDKTYEIAVNLAADLKTHIDAKLAAFPSATGGLTDAQVRQVVRQELDKTRLIA